MPRVSLLLGLSFVILAPLPGKAAPRASNMILAQLPDLLVVPPNVPATNRELDFSAPLPPRVPSRSSQLYRVDISGESPLLLTQVQSVEPDAFVRRGEGVIQAGVYASEANAQQRVRMLASLGIRAQVVPIGADTANSRRLEPSRSYLVVIPGRGGNLAEMETKVIQLGVNREVVSLRGAPKGSHLAIGPFTERLEAERWSSYLRAEGMDARVYYGR